MALLNLLLLPILAALGLFDANGDAGGSGASGDAGGSGDGGNAGGGTQAGGRTAGEQGGASSGAASGSGSASAGQGATPPPAPQQGTSLQDVEKLQRELNEARGEAAKYRAAGLRTIAQALGIELPAEKDDDDQKGAIASLQKEIDTLRSEARTNAIEAAFERTIAKLGAKPVLTRRYVAAQIEALDPKADDFASKLEQIVQAAIDEEPALKAAQAASRSGGEFNAGANGGSEDTPLSIDELRKQYRTARAGG